MKKILMTVLVLAQIAVAKAQVSTEVGFNIGTSNYLGDLQTADFTYRNQHLFSGIYGRYNANAQLAFRGFFNYGRLSGDDKNSGEQDLIKRNLHFRTNIIELGIQAEINVLPFNKFDPNKKKAKRYFNWTPYFFGGFNLLQFNPKAQYNGDWIALQPLCTEGQNSSFNSQKEYSLTQIAIPFGIGLKFQVNPQICIGFELGARKTFTDYLDDVSGNYPDLAKLQAEKGFLSAALSFRGDELPGFTTAQYPAPGAVRGHSDNLDWYLTNTISIAYRFYSKR
jgi:hypothetical protein